MFRAKKVTSQQFAAFDKKVKVNCVLVTADTGAANVELHDALTYAGCSESTLKAVIKAAANTTTEKTLPIEFVTGCFVVCRNTLPEVFLYF